MQKNLQSSYDIMYLDLSRLSGQNMHTVATKSIGTYLYLSMKRFFFFLADSTFHLRDIKVL